LAAAVCFGCAGTDTPARPEIGNEADIIASLPDEPIPGLEDMGTEIIRIAAINDQLVFDSGEFFILREYEGLLLCYKYPQFFTLNPLNGETAELVNLQPGVTLDFVDCRDGLLVWSEHDAAAWRVWLFDPAAGTTVLVDEDSHKDEVYINFPSVAIGGSKIFYGSRVDPDNRGENRSAIMMYDMQTKVKKMIALSDYSRPFSGFGGIAASDKYAVWHTAYYDYPNSVQHDILTFYDIDKEETMPPYGLRGLEPVMAGDTLIYQQRKGYELIVSDIVMFDIGASHGRHITEGMRRECYHITGNGRFVSWLENSDRPLTVYDMPNNKYYVFDNEDAMTAAILGDWLIWSTRDRTDSKEMKCLLLSDLEGLI
jgi:hypothetical protein